VLCCGNLVYDTLIRPVDELNWGGTTFVEAIECHAGGNGGNTSRALAILGTPVRILGAVADDEPGRFLVQQLRIAGVDTNYLERVIPPTSATAGLVRSSGERKFFHCMGASREAFADAISFSPAMCEGMTHFHFASMFVLPQLRARGSATLIAAEAAGLTTSFDTNWDPQNGWMGSLRPCLPHIGTLFMNQDEGRMITGSDEPKKMAQCILQHGTETLAIKLGARGCAIYNGDREVVCPAFEVHAVDSTGAGDCFAAGYLTAVLGGASLAEAGRFANAVAAMSVEKLGAVNGVVSETETYAWLSTARVRAL
jgi:sugar/nucleoside kinase (ribokinase family)